MYPKVINLFNFRVSKVQKAYNLVYVDHGGNELIQHVIENESLSIQKVILSQNDVNEHIGLAIYYGGVLCGMKLQDTQWTAVDELNMYWSFCDVIDFKGKFFAVSSKGDVAILDYSFNVLQTIDSPRDVHLLESFRELFLVSRNYDTSLNKLSYDEKTRSYIQTLVRRRITIEVKVYKLNEMDNEWEEVGNLGDTALFVGEDCCWSVSAQYFAGSRGNCIYFYDVFPCENRKKDEVIDSLLEGSSADICVYNLNDGTGEPLAYHAGYSNIFWRIASFFLNVVAT